MILALVLLAIGLVAGLARGGKLANLGELDLKLPALVFVGLGLQVSAELVAALIYPELGAGALGIVILMLSYVCLIGFLAINRSLPGSVVVAAGLGLNMLVIGLNRAMPVSVRAARAAGIESAKFLEAAVKHEAMTPNTILGFLGDVIPVPLIGTVVSIGDVLIGIGIFILVSRVVGYQARRHSRTRLGARNPETP
jgi:hypothetical protein